MTVPPLIAPLHRIMERLGIEPLDPDALDTMPLVDDEAASHLRQLELTRWANLIPDRFRDVRLADYAAEPFFDALNTWAHENPCERNLIICGPVGTMKTSAAVAACWPTYERGGNVRFEPVVELLDDLRPGGPEDAVTRLLDVDRLILDDLGAERGTEWAAERIYLLVNRRWMERRPVIATVNVEPKALSETLGERTFSRLVGSGACTLRLGGKDRRRR